MKKLCQSLPRSQEKPVKILTTTVGVAESSKRKVTNGQIRLFDHGRSRSSSGSTSSLKGLWGKDAWMRAELYLTETTICYNIEDIGVICTVKPVSRPYINHVTCRHVKCSLKTWLVFNSPKHLQQVTPEHVNSASISILWTTHKQRLSLDFSTQLSFTLTAVRSLRTTLSLPANGRQQHFSRHRKWSGLHLEKIMQIKRSDLLVLVVCACMLN